ncbi:MAG: hypothetical protein M3153_04550 [Chloroflexota bacterium]|nr:hypothetical protein [Chloroflexota bacterium]
MGKGVGTGDEVGVGDGEAVGGAALAVGAAEGAGRACGSPRPGRMATRTRALLSVMLSPASTTADGVALVRLREAVRGNAMLRS